MSKNKKVLLIQVPSIKFSPATPYAGIGYLGEMLYTGGVEYSILDMLLGYPLAALVKKIKFFKPDILAVSMMTIGYKRNYEMLNYLKDLFPGMTILIGGPHASAFKDLIFQECRGIDLLALHEGEETILELAQGKERNRIAGLIYKDNGKIIVNPLRKSNNNLDSLAFPTYRNFELEKYTQQDIHIVTSRGCPYSCIFCTVSTSMGKMVRARSARNVVDEIEYWVRRGRRIFGIADDNFTFYKNRVYEICDEIKRRKLGRLEFRCNNGIRPDRIDKDILKRMKDVGFDYIQISVESASQRVLDSMRKNEKIQTIARAVENAIEVGMEVQLAFVIGTPNETPKDLEESFAFARKYPVWKADHNHLYPYPGTELFTWAEANNAFIKSPEEYLNDDNPDYKSVPVMESAELSREERIRAGVTFRRISQELCRNAAYRKLKRFGPLGRVMAYIFPTPLGQYLFYRNKIFRRIADKLRLVLK